MLHPQFLFLHKEETSPAASTMPFGPWSVGQLTKYTNVSVSELKKSVLQRFNKFWVALIEHLYDPVLDLFLPLWCIVVTACQFDFHPNMWFNSCSLFCLLSESFFSVLFLWPELHKWGTASLGLGLVPYCNISFVFLEKRNSNSLYEVTKLSSQQGRKRLAQSWLSFHSPSSDEIHEGVLRLHFEGQQRYLTNTHIHTGVINKCGGREDECQRKTKWQTGAIESQGQRKKSRCGTWRGCWYYIV